MTTTNKDSIKTHDLATIANKFVDLGNISEIQPIGSGNINDTFLVTINSIGEASETRFILQRINTQVFRQPELVMQNMRILTEHARDRLRRNPPGSDRRWEIPQVVSTQDGMDYWLDPDGSFWRALGFVSNSYSLDAIQDRKHAHEIGYALGTFHNLISDLSPDKLADTLEGFHITPLYLEQYKSVLARSSHPSQSPDTRYCMEFIRDRQSWARVLEDAKAKGKLPLRLMHGDPKVNNVMIDIDSQQAVSIIDLDTVKPGLIHYDIGDCLRSGCNPLGEETDCLGSVCFESELCQSILQAYLTETSEFLTKHDYDYIYDSIRSIAFELGLRFFTDYLAGNAYFKIAYPEHNLARALVQFKLVESIESQESTIRQIVEDMR
ncbi:aminoglycoside phosphotransferase family protein [Pseudanabaena sp. PCC 6802]|uniref:phosphotransferase enzyme family protein n=1 Tax=Pseudanabaena sp. PCC 6802 TaxID=118173 RepID=UPI0005681BE6